MIKRIATLFLLCLPVSQLIAQTEMHNTMFMYNKMYYNPAYTGNKDMTSVNAYYRDQWSDIEGAPKTMGVSLEAALGDKNQEVRQTGLGLTINSEQIGVEKKQEVFGYYTFRFKLDNGSVLSTGLRVGTQLYSANYSDLNPYQTNDPNLVKNVSNASLFNFGLGAFWHNENCYLGFSIPNLSENYYDKNERSIKNIRARQVRGYYFNGGYVVHAGESVDILPQVMARYTGDASYSLPFNCDINLSFVANKRFVLGLTYRTDKSIEAMFHMQLTKELSLGYSYDYVVSQLSGYTGGAHEVLLGIDFARRKYEHYERPHYISLF